MSDFQVGDVFRYPYLWASQQIAGEETGRKERPVCLAFNIQRNEDTILYILPISSTPPAPGQNAVAVPDLEARRAGLPSSQSWIKLVDVNTDILGKSYDLNPNTQIIGRFSPRFVQRVRLKFAQALKTGTIKAVNRQ